MNPPEKLPVATMIEKYIQLRTKVAEIKELHTIQLKPFSAAMEQLEGLLLNALNTAGVDSMRGGDGTVFKSTETSVTVKDWPATFGYIQSHELWDLLEARVSKTAAMAVIADTGNPIPGVNVVQRSVLRVRRS